MWSETGGLFPQGKAIRALPNVGASEASNGPARDQGGVYFESARAS